jgi:hypothetical protein
LRSHAGQLERGDEFGPFRGIRRKGDYRAGRWRSLATADAGNGITAAMLLACGATGATCREEMSLPRCGPKPQRAAARGSGGDAAAAGSNGSATASSNPWPVRR